MQQPQRLTPFLLCKGAPHAGCCPGMSLYLERRAPLTAFQLAWNEESKPAKFLSLLDPDLIVTYSGFFSAQNWFTTVTTE